MHFKASEQNVVDWLEFKQYTACGGVEALLASAGLQLPHVRSLVYLKKQPEHYKTKSSLKLAMGNIIINEHIPLGTVSSRISSVLKTVA